jgi:hypothetical protein
MLVKNLDSTLPLQFSARTFAIDLAFCLTLIEQLADHAYPSENRSTLYLTCDTSHSSFDERANPINMAYFASRLQIWPPVLFTCNNHESAPHLYQYTAYH